MSEGCGAFITLRCYFARGLTAEWKYENVSDIVGAFFFVLKSSGSCYVVARRRE